MRYLIVLVTALAAAVPAAATSPPVALPEPAARATQAAALSAPVFVVTGGGNGHGVGMSQFGALAQARAGRSYRDILAFYYRGTSIGRASRPAVRVLLAAGRRAVRIASEAPIRVTDASGATFELPAGEAVLRDDLRIDGAPSPLVTPVTFRPAAGTLLSLDGSAYRGDLRVTLDGGRLQVVDVVGLEAYLLGVLAGEVPREWPAEALKAQAVAARSYALASLVAGRSFDLYADGRSQVYGGVARESPTTSAAVRATRGEVVMFEGKVASTLYYSSSGGRTASSEDVFGARYGYLRSVADPWDRSSPYHRWTPRTYTAAALAAALGLASPVVDAQSATTASGRPASVSVSTSDGATVLLRAADVSQRLGLLSSAFRLGVLRLGVPAQLAGSYSVVPGAAVTLTGLARDVQGALLERLGTTGTWAPVARVTPARDGTFDVTVRPARTSTYRLSAAGTSGPALTLTVPAGTTG